MVAHCHCLCLQKSSPDSYFLGSFLILISPVFLCKTLFSLFFYDDTFLNFISWFYGLFLLVHCIFTLANLRSQYCLWFSAGIFLSILSCLFTQLQLVLCANVPCKSPLFYLIFLYPAQMSDVVCDLFFWMSHSKYKFNRVFLLFFCIKVSSEKSLINQREKQTLF